MAVPSSKQPVSNMRSSAGANYAFILLIHVSTKAFSLLYLQNLYQLKMFALPFLFLCEQARVDVDTLVLCTAGYTKIITGIKAGGCYLVILVYMIEITFFDVLGNLLSFTAFFQFYMTYHVWSQYLCLWRFVIHPRKVIIIHMYNDSHEWFKWSNNKLSFFNVCVLIGLQYDTNRFYPE